jgi:UDPglucose 6-dehydrogenase
MKKSIAVIGQGFVGASLTTVMSERGFGVYAYDKASIYAPQALKIRNTTSGGYPENITELIQTLEGNAALGFSGIYFVCVPTPMHEDGSADLSIVEQVLSHLSSVPGERIAVIKSTVPPGSTEKWNKQYVETELRIVFNPEFLTEANALDDMRNQNRIVLGGPRPHINKVKQIFQTAFPKVQIIKTSSSTAEMVKYFTNVHLAVRVALSCELWQICEKLDSMGMNIDYDKVKEYACYDTRLGNSHMSVPGNSGIPGFLGHCMPKDINSLISLAKSVNVKSTVMEGAWDKNLEIIAPEDRDWEKMIGRAVSKKKI